MPREGAARQLLCADFDGFSLPAAVRSELHDHKRLEQLCRYITRPALSDERVQLNDNAPAAARRGRTMDRRWPRSMLALAGIAVLAAAACGTYRPQDVKPGMGEAEVAALIGRPTGHYPRPDGQTRLEFATGPHGRVTWMVDLDASGKVIDAPQQVLNEAYFSWIQQNARDRDSKWLLYNLGRPGEVMRLGWIGGQVWSWRYPTFDCLWFQVTVNDDGSLRDAGGYGIDPRCDAPSDRVGGRR
jgi:hypothetical protein